MLMQRSGNTILITGGSAGIGLALAAKFLELGNEVIVTGRRQTKLDEAKAAHPGLHTYASDVGDVEAVASLVQVVRANHPTLNVLINNAGIMLYKNLRSPSRNLETLTAELDVNVAGTIRMNSAFIDLLRQNKGTIVNVSSGLAYVPLPCAPIYCATKAAIHSYTVSLRFQLADQGVDVIELMPPAVDTDLNANLDPNAGVKLMPLDVLVAATFKGLWAGHAEIRPGQAGQLHMMSRIAPGFINGQLAKASLSMIPEPE